MKYALLALLLFISFPVYAGYQSGYDDGYYRGEIYSSDQGMDYGRGVEQGSWDAYQEDRQRTQEEEAIVEARTQEASYALQRMTEQSRLDLQRSTDAFEAQAEEWYAEHPDAKRY